MKNFFMGALLILMTSIAFAQAAKGKAAITIINEQKAPVEGATVELLRSKDSALVKTAVTDKTGAIEIDNIIPSTYLFRVTSVGLKTFYSKVFEIKESETTALPGVTMITGSASQMQEVTVTARKPFIQARSKVNPFAMSKFIVSFSRVYKFTSSHVGVTSGK